MVYNITKKDLLLVGAGISLSLGPSQCDSNSEGYDAIIKGLLNYPDESK